jgi:hypothetical protein
MCECTFEIRKKKPLLFFRKDFVIHLKYFPKREFSLFNERELSLSTTSWAQCSAQQVVEVSFSEILRF